MTQMNTSSLFLWTTQQKVSNTFYTPPNLLKKIFYGIRTTTMTVRSITNTSPMHFQRKTMTKSLHQEGRKEFQGCYHLESRSQYWLLSELLDWTQPMSALKHVESHTSTNTYDMLNIYICMYKLWPTAPRLYCVDRSRWRSHILQPPLHRAVDDLQAVFVQLAYQQQHRLQDVGILKQVHSQALKFTGVGASSNAGPGPKHFLRPVYTEIRIKMHLKTKQNCSFFNYIFF